LFSTETTAQTATKQNGQTAYQDVNTFAKADWRARAISADSSGETVKGGREKDVIAAEAIDAALRRIGKHIFVETGLANSLGDVLFSRERFVSSFVFDEFDAAEKAPAANIADVWCD